MYFSVFDAVGDVIVDIPITLNQLDEIFKLILLLNNLRAQGAKLEAQVILFSNKSATSLALLTSMELCLSSWS